MRRTYLLFSVAFVNDLSCSVVPPCSAWGNFYDYNVAIRQTESYDKTSVLKRGMQILGIMIGSYAVMVERLFA